MKPMGIDRAIDAGPTLVQNQILEHEPAVDRLPHASTGDGSDPRKELREGEGFGDVVVSPQIEASDPVVHVGASREEQDRCRHAHSAQLAQHVEAIGVGQHDVQHNQVVVAEGCALEADVVV